MVLKYAVVWPRRPAAFENSGRDAIILSSTFGSYSVHSTAVVALVGASAMGRAPKAPVPDVLLCLLFPRGSWPDRLVLFCVAVLRLVFL
jgi:hypothetical protein